MSASTDPDKAFDWISETWKEGQTIGTLRDVGKFTTLDAKLLSALTNILTGDFARKVDTYKETEATNHRYVRSRQVLFMMHEHFSTNIKHGATYSLQDLFSVKLKGDNLRGFISNWDQVMAGIPKVPEINILETLFFNQLKNSKAIAHDLQEYHRAEEGTDKKSYDFLVTAVRRYLDRERLESNRERVARTLGASSSNAAPAVGEKTGYIPKGYCVKWNKVLARMMPAHSSMKSLHRRKIEVNQGPHLIVADHLQGARMIRARRSSHANFGNREDVTEAVNVDSVTRANNPSLLVPPLLLGLRPMTRKDPDERTAEVQEKAGIARQSRRDQGVPGIAAPQRGIKVSLTLPKLP